MNLFLPNPFAMELSRNYLGTILARGRQCSVALFSYTVRRGLGCRLSGIGAPGPNFEIYLRVLKKLIYQYRKKNVLNVPPGPENDLKG